MESSLQNQKQEKAGNLRKPGKVWLAGAGPGDAGLLTVKAERLLKEADVILYDALVSTEILCRIPRGTRCVNVGKRSGAHIFPQEEINAMLVREAKAGRKVLRLKGGDPFVFGRGGEELEVLKKNGIPFEVVPGVTSACAVAAYGGIPVTHRDYASSLHIVTGHPKKGSDSAINYGALVQAGGTLVFLMGVSAMKEIFQGLLAAGISPSLPAAIISRGTMAGQRSLVSDVEHLPKEAARQNFQPPAVVIVGEVCGLEKEFTWESFCPLSGRQFLLTRPALYNGGFAQELRLLGARVLELPSVDMKPLEPCRHLFRALETFAQEKNEEGWLVFTSVYGVHTFFSLLRREGMDLRVLLKRPGTIRFAAIGKTTGHALEEHGIFPDLVPSIYDGAHLGEELAQTALPGSRILAVRTRDGSPDLIPPLEKAGLEVQDLAVYETIRGMDERFRDQVLEEIRENRVDGVIFASSSAVQGFGASVPKDLRKKITAVCIGKRTAQEASALGMPVAISREASQESVKQKILELFGKGFTEGQEDHGGLSL